MKPKLTKMLTIYICYRCHTRSTIFSVLQYLLDTLFKRSWIDSNFIIYIIFNCLKYYKLLTIHQRALIFILLTKMIKMHCDYLLKIVFTNETDLIMRCLKQKKNPYWNSWPNFSHGVKWHQLFGFFLLNIHST